MEDVENLPMISPPGRCDEKERLHLRCLMVQRGIDLGGKSGW